MKMLEDIMSQIASGGWDELENAGANFSKMAKEQGQAERQEIDRQADIIARTFRTKAGKECIKLLLQLTVLRQPDELERAAASVEGYAISKAKREGQNAIVFMLLARLQHHDGQSKQPGGEL